MIQLFTDGGLIGPKNPCPLGGTWAWCVVKDDEEIEYGLGYIVPETWDFPTISNNVSELFAAKRGLSHLLFRKWRPSEGFQWWTDSNVTRCRVVNKNPKWNGVPADLINLFTQIRTHKINAVLCAGHPTKKELAEGRRKRNGLLTSKWNVRVDQLCKEAIELFKADPVNLRKAEMLNITLK